MTCGAGGGSRLNWIPLIELSRGVWMCAAALNTSRIFESESLTWMAEADCHARNGQTLQVCVSGSHCWDHEPALVCLSEKTANDCSLFLSPLFSLSLCVYIFLGLQLGLEFAACFSWSFVIRTPRQPPRVFI